MIFKTGTLLISRTEFIILMFICYASAHNVTSTTKATATTTTTATTTILKTTSRTTATTTIPTTTGLKITTTRLPVDLNDTDKNSSLAAVQVPAVGDGLNSLTGGQSNSLTGGQLNSRRGKDLVYESMKMRSGNWKPRSPDDQVSV